MDTELIETLETSSHEATIKTSQFHCTLSKYSPDTPECTFQCDTKLELDKHIKINHNKKTQLQYSVCMIYLSDLDDLAKHMTDTHKNGFPCTNC